VKDSSRNYRLDLAFKRGWDDPEVIAAHEWVMSGGELCRISGNPCRYAFTCPVNVEVKFKQGVQGHRVGD